MSSWLVMVSQSHQAKRGSDVRHVCLSTVRCSIQLRVSPQTLGHLATLATAVGIFKGIRTKPLDLIQFAQFRILFSIIDS